MPPELSPLAFVAGLLLVYAALAICIHSRVQVPVRSAAVPAQARRRGRIPRTLRKLTDQAVQTLNKGVRGSGRGHSEPGQARSTPGLKKQPGDYLLMAGAVTFAGAVVVGFLLGGPFFAVLLLVLAPVALVCS